MVESGMGIVGMVEYVVEDYVYFCLLGVVVQLEQCCVVVKLWIDVLIIFGIVFMYVGGGENWIQIQSGYVELFQVGKFFVDVVEIFVVEC